MSRWVIMRTPRQNTAEETANFPGGKHKEQIVTNNLAIFDQAVKPDDGGIHDWESIGSILRRLRMHCEAQMTPDFHLPLSLTIDELVQREEALSQDEEGQP
jgi:hypothetical protein